MCICIAQIHDQGLDHLALDSAIKYTVEALGLGVRRQLGDQHVLQRLCVCVCVCVHIYMHKCVCMYPYLYLIYIYISMHLIYTYIYIYYIIYKIL